MSDIRPAISCACPYVDARRCYRRRYGLDLHEMLDSELDLEADKDEGCTCSCHEAELDDEDTWP